MQVQTLMVRGTTNDLGLDPHLHLLTSTASLLPPRCNLLLVLKMKLILVLSGLALIEATAVVPDPHTTPLARLGRRQNNDSALVGWVSTSGASECKLAVHISCPLRCLTLQDSVDNALTVSTKCSLRSSILRFPSHGLDLGIVRHLLRSELFLRLFHWLLEWESHCRIYKCIL